MMKFPAAKIETILAHYERQTEDEALKEDEANSEVGRELSVEDLKPGTVVYVQAEGRSIMVTLWVEMVDEEMVWLLSNTLNRHFGCFRYADGLLRDDSGRRIRLFEFLGKP